MHPITIAASHTVDAIIVAALFVRGRGSRSVGGLSSSGQARVSEVLVDFKEIGIAHWGNVFIAV